jgi:hypothetical protein
MLGRAHAFPLIFFHLPCVLVLSRFAAVVGRCVACGCPWDDYAHRRRCTSCRMLLLVCDACAPATAASSADSAAESQPGMEEADGAGSRLQQPQEQQHEQDQQQQEQEQQELEQQQRQDGQGLVCELCQRRKEQGAGMPPSGGRRLRILCLHGFRQSAKNFEVS